MCTGESALVRVCACACVGMRACMLCVCACVRVLIAGFWSRFALEGEEGNPGKGGTKARFTEGKTGETEEGEGETEKGGWGGKG